LNVALQPTAQFCQRLYEPSLKLDALTLKRQRAADQTVPTQRPPKYFYLVLPVTQFTGNP